MALLPLKQFLSENLANRIIVNQYGLIKNGLIAPYCGSPSYLKFNKFGFSKSIFYLIFYPSNERSVYLETKLSSRNFAKKRTSNEQTCFSILTNQNWNSSFKYFRVVRIEKTSLFVCSFGRSYGSTILFQDLLTFRNSMTHPTLIFHSMLM